LYEVCWEEELRDLEEDSMRSRKILWTVVMVVMAFAIMAAAQDQAKKEIKHVPIKPTSAASGQEMYKNYCAVCHGVDGKGKGPAVDALKVPPPDLTTLAQKNGGAYPAMKVAAVLRGEEVMAAHGSKDMPVWGNLFWHLSGGRASEVQQRVANLNTYIESLQKK
jgi:mono/diheme cytochrome c family protein